MKVSAWLFLLLLVSCKHDDELVSTDYVLAGVVLKNMVYHDFEPDMILDSSDNENYYLKIDINNDGINDLELENYKGAYSTIRPLNTENNQISINLINMYNVHYRNLVYLFYGNVLRHNHNDVINYLGDWSPTILTMNGQNVGHRNYSLHIKEHDSSYSNNWYNTTNGYLGIRFEQENNTRYGWVQISLVGTRIVIHDCAYQIK